jgi:Helicase HerA, central domain
MPFDQADSPFGASVLAESSPMRSLLTEADRVGGIFRLSGFHEALVVTNDAFVFRAHGVPQHCFLLAAVEGFGDPEQAGSHDPDDEEVLLLRVTSTAALPDEADGQRLRAHAARELLTESARSRPRDRDQLIDPLIEQEMQTAGLRCHLLGTFFDVHDSGTTRLAFGSDLDALYAYSRYSVYKPYGRSLELVVSYLEGVRSFEQPGVIELGRVRYASTGRREDRASRAGKSTRAPVRVNVDDFVAHKTAVFGITRGGKSNMLKVIACATFQFAQETGRTIGQLIFDPAAEYAEVNVQDQTALAAIGPEFVRRYRFGATASDLTNDRGLRPLALNFFDETQVEAAWEITKAFLRVRPPADYVNAFMAADPVGPGDTEDAYRERAHAKRVRFLLYAAFLKAGLPAPDGWRFWAPLGADIRSELVGLTSPSGTSLGFLDDCRTSKRGEVELGADQLTLVADTLAAAGAAGQAPPHMTQWLERPQDLRSVALVLAGARGSGYRILTPLRDGYHAPHADADYAPHIYEDLVAGRIVIIDLSRGNDAVLQFASERIVNYLLFRAAERFREGKDMREIQVFLEEAHRLLDREKFRNPQSADPYVRLAKEAAKFRIGLVYATQEVSTVDDSILSNTTNWVVAHLNNEREVKHLAGRYRFEDWAEQILNAEEPGFIRLKTRSSRFVIPLQVRKFDAEMVSRARSAAFDRAQGRVPDTLPPAEDA